MPYAVMSDASGVTLRACVLCDAEDEMQKCNLHTQQSLIGNFYPTSLVAVLFVLWIQEQCSECHTLAALPDN